MSCNNLATRKIIVDKPHYVLKQCPSCSKPVIEFLEKTGTPYKVEEIPN